MTLPRFREHTFVASNLVDEKLETSWQYRPSSTSREVKVVLRFAEAIEVHAICVANGFQLDSYEFGDLFAQNARIKKALLRLGKQHFRLGLGSHDRGFMVFPLPSPVMTRFIEMRIEDYWPGNRWNDVAVSELRVLGRIPPAEVVDKEEPPAAGGGSELRPPATTDVVREIPDEASQQSAASMTEAAIVQRNSGRIQAAVDTYLQAVRRYPRHVWARYGLASLYSTMGRPIDALTQLDAIAKLGTSEAQRALRLAKTNPDFAPLRNTSKFQSLVK